MNSYDKGKWAERVAGIYLQCCGYRLVCKNFKTGRGTTAGEIDLIMQKKHTLIFVEVKQRESLDAAAYAVSARQRQRILSGARSFLQKHREYDDFDKRFDCVLVHFPFRIKHLVNAWQDES
ncbi:MAG: YraN family protein [Alphaproteobacteria bacterium]|jgi:putative endonuclease|nr:YraN family protein [Alphaproteobacteria bacterium]